MKNLMCIAVAVVLMGGVAWPKTGEAPAKGVAASPDQRVVEILGKLADDVQIGSKALAQAAEQVKVASRGDSFSALQRVFEDPKCSGLRCRVLLVVGTLQLSEAPGLFVDVLRKGTADREKAIALDFLKDPKSDEAVREIALAVTRRASMDVQGRASKIIGSLREKKREKLIEILRKMIATPGLTPEASLTRSTGAMLLGTIPGDDITSLLCRELQNSDDEVRVRVLRALGARRERLALEQMAEIMISDSNPAVRQEATYSIGLMADESSIPSLVEAVGSEDPKVAAGAARSLRRMTGMAFGANSAQWALWWQQYTENRDKLYGMLDSTSPKLVLQAIGLLSRERLGRAEIAEKIEGLVGSDSAQIQQQAIIALGELRQTRSVPTLIEALETNDSKTIVLVLQAIAKTKDTANETIETVERYVSDYDGPVCAAACDTLGELGGERAVDFLVEATASLEGKPLRSALAAMGKAPSTSPKVVEVLCGFVGAEDEGVAVEACNALAQKRSRKAVPVLVEALGDSRAPVVSAAHNALKKTTSKNMPPEPAAWNTWLSETASE